MIKKGESIVKVKRIRSGIYEYKGYNIHNCGYHHPDHCVWWEAVDLKTGCADYHATTKRELMAMIDENNKGESNE